MAGVMHHPFINKVKKYKDGALLLDKVIFHRFGEVCEHSLGDDAVNAFGSIVGGECEHTARGAYADAVKNYRLYSVAFFKMLYPSDEVTAFLKADGVELAVAFSVCSRIKDYHVAAVLSVGNSKIVSVFSVFGPSRKNYNGLVVTEIVIFSVKIETVSYDMYILFIGGILLRPLAARGIHIL